MSLKRSSLLALCLLFVLFVTSTLVNIWLLTRSNGSLNDVNKEIRVVLSIIDPINHSRTLRVRAMEYMKEMDGSITLSSRPTLDGVFTVMKKADAAFEAYRQAPRIAGEAELEAKYIQAYQAYRDQGLRPLITAAQANDRPGFNQQIAVVIKLDAQYEKVLDQVLDLHERYARELNNEASQHFTFGLILIISFAILFLAVIIAVMVLLKRLVLNPIARAEVHCREISEGVLDNPVPVTGKSKNEIQSLMRAMEQMRTALTHIIRQVRQSCDSVYTAAQEIAAGNTDLASRTEEQASALTETAASMEQLGATVKQNTDNVLEASRLTSAAVTSAQSGETISREVNDTMAQINRSSKKIEDIIGVINSIAFQTNILALNAAVEAARAGEQGRGFAVVAGEVRLLAQRSAVAAKEIEGLISESVANIKSGTQQVTHTGEVIQTIITSVSRVNVLMDHIATASEEQSRGIGQIEQAVTEMDSVTQQNSALVQQSAAAASSLEEQVNHLSRMVSSFRLSTQ
ncbi:MAG: Methyl-accepting chemotaxis protein III [Candidatus Erwinia impunctatus]|nr:Methyl-accepting chemotaxis protein III [Culicoides impunctatus]